MKYIGPSETIVATQYIAKYSISYGSAISNDPDFKFYFILANLSKDMNNFCY